MKHKQVEYRTLKQNETKYLTNESFSCSGTVLSLHEAVSRVRIWLHEAVSRADILQERNEFFIHRKLRFINQKLSERLYLGTFVFM